MLSGHLVLFGGCCHKMRVIQLNSAKLYHMNTWVACRLHLEPSGMLARARGCRVVTEVINGCVPIGPSRGGPDPAFLLQLVCACVAWLHGAAFKTRRE